MSDTETAILKAAEKMVRESGYNGFSFRNIASVVGIKSASVHYYYPTKEDLGAAVAKAYTDRFIDGLGAPADLASSGKDPIKVYIAAFRTALVSDKRMCLCGILGAEISGLPEAVVRETKDFFTRNLAWLQSTYQLSHSEKISKTKAIQTLSLLEGAMISASVLGEVSAFDQSAALLA